MRRIASSASVRAHRDLADSAPAYYGTKFRICQGRVRDVFRVDRFAQAM